MGAHEYLDANTRYITEKDSNRLEELAGVGGSEPLRVISHEYGFWVHDSLDASHDDNLGLSADFWKLMKKAHDMGCSWVNLDRDGEDDLDLPIHHW